MRIKNIQEEGKRIFELQISNNARKSILTLSVDIRKSILEKLELLREDPFNKQLDIKKLKGRKEEFRLKAGDYRIIYSVLKDKILILVLKVAHRKDVYKK